MAEVTGIPRWLELQAEIDYRIWLLNEMRRQLDAEAGRLTPLDRLIDEATGPRPRPPAFDFKAYGVSLALVGEEGAMMADGHVPLVRFAAACNRIARTELLCRNLLDYSGATLAEALEGMRHCWALPADDPDGDGCDWYVRWGGVTAETPGAIPVTLWEP